MHPPGPSPTVVVVTGASPLDRRAVAAVPPDALSSPPTAGSTTPAPPGWTPPCSSATSTRSRRSAWPGRPSTSRSCATRSTRRPPTPSWPSPTPRRYDPTRILLVAGQGDRLDHAIAALGALARRSWPAVASLEAWWGSDQLHVRPRPPRHRARPARRDRVLGARHARPGRGVTVSGPAGRYRPRPRPLVGLGVSNVAAPTPDHPLSVTVADGIVTVVVPGAAS